MGYRRMKKRDLWEIYRRWQAGQSLSHIAVNERRDRKTVRYYLERFGNLDLAPSGTKARHITGGLFSCSCRALIPLSDSGIINEHSLGLLLRIGEPPSRNSLFGGRHEKGSFFSKTPRSRGPAFDDFRQRATGLCRRLCSKAFWGRMI
jgi:hypothetical protein